MPWNFWSVGLLKAKNKQKSAIKTGETDFFLCLPSVHLVDHNTIRPEKMNMLIKIGGHHMPARSVINFCEHFAYACNKREGSRGRQKSVHLHISERVGYLWGNMCTKPLNVIMGFNGDKQW
jgi:hypothetical protein